MTKNTSTQHTEVAATGNGRLTAALLVAGAVAVNVAFLGLGAAFDYPNALNKPADEVLATFHAGQVVITGWFLLRAAGAGLLAPIAVRVGRLGRSTALRVSVPVGIAAAAVQVVGLLRWPLVVPGLAAQAGDPAAAETFGTLNLVLGTVIGETLGYALTAAWTVLVAVGLQHAGQGRALLGRSLTIIGIASAALIVAGIVEPLDVPGTGLANFVGYVVWSGWLVAVAILVLLTGSRTAGLHTGLSADRRVVSGV